MQHANTIFPNHLHTHGSMGALLAGFTRCHASIKLVQFHAYAIAPDELTTSGTLGTLSRCSTRKHGGMLLNRF